MRSVHLWACPCGSHIKAICEYDASQKPTSANVVCEKCGHVMRLDGTLVQLFAESEDGTWTVISSPGNNF